MPFTFSHPAIVLPLCRLSPKWFSVTGLVAGSLTPDFEYFLRMRIHGEYAHTLPGIFVFCLPVGLILTFLFHNLVRNSLLVSLPAFLRSRMIDFTTFNWNHFFRKRWYVVVASIILSAASHIFWDGFTHADGYFVQVFPALAGNAHLFGLQVEVYRLLQHLSTLVGGIAILLVILSLPRRALNDTLAGRWKYWTTLIALAVIVFAIAILSRGAIPSFVDVIVIIISSTLLSLILTSLLSGNGGVVVPSADKRID